MPKLCYREFLHTSSNSYAPLQLPCQSLRIITELCILTLRIYVILQVDAAVDVECWWRSADSRL